MKKIFIILSIIGCLAGSYSCQDDFLQKPDISGTVDLEKIYSSTKNAESALFRCYRDVLKHGWPTGIGLGHGTLGAISGEVSKGWSWHATWQICSVGLMPTRHTNSTTGSAGAEHFGQNWEYIRACFLVKENIDRVPDMDDKMKGYIKGEATALIAYRYMGMFYRFGGVPIVKGSFMPEDDLAIPRFSLQETLDYTLELLDEASNALPDSWANIGGNGIYVGRITKGAALAMKARLLMFAARPLFNSATPYLDFDNPEDNSLICFGKVDPERWRTAIAANEAVLTWAAANGYELINTGGAGVGQPNPNAGEDYGTATSVLNNKEVLLSYKLDEDGQIALYYNTSGNYPEATRSDSGQSGLLTNHLENYYDKDGNDMDWPKVGESKPRPAQNWLDNIDKVEPRFRMDVCAIGVGSLSNPGISTWQHTAWGRRLVNLEINSGATSGRFPEASQVGYGAGPSTKFYYKAGSRLWFEPPLFRMAEIYLNLAEAYNEAGDPVNALKNLNMVHNRAGLPSITETDKEQLKRRIWREKAIEYFHENHRYYDAKHWKHPEIATNIHGGQKRELQFRVTANSGSASALIEYWDANAYVTYWHPKMFLEPFLQDEVNKGIIVQNPGY
ncbi:RagB/SusD family nutrient uptake outer membrane protein [Bacteroides sp. 51]|uniref:RagB/SusD family nutrient uptake outer membrane protein n=1 Tax=Bacteroides sp. 51 TaxID=2302938 RepID=UPI0013D27B68|nr:RagB/SusD family nutrient uptake outer membrane protein [Bacteroides sp. 51]